MVAAFVTIRMNSTRLPGKNILPLNGHPLAWRICQTLLNCHRVDEIYIFCSDEKIMNYVPPSPRLIFRQRSKNLDGDEVTMHEVYDSFFSEVNADIYVAALATAPFISADAIDQGIKAIAEEGYDSSLSVRRMQTFAWYNNRPLNFSISRVPRTQELVPLYIETCGFYAFRREVWLKHHRRTGTNPCFVEVSLREAVDIDTPEDYQFAQMIAHEQ